MSESVVEYLQQAKARAYTPEIFKGLKVESINRDFSYGRHLATDFCGFGGTVSSNVGTYFDPGLGAIKSYEDTGSTVALQTDDVNCELKLTTDTTDNDEIWLASNYDAGGHALVSDTSGSDFALGFECRVKFAQITDTYNFFIGLAEEGLAAADTITDAGALADKDFLGFSVLQDDGDALDIVYRKEGGAVQTVESGAQTLVADTWYQLGFRYDPGAPAAERIRFYIDGVDAGSYVTSTNIAASTFPDGEELVVLFGLKNGAAASKSVSVDWIKFAQSAVSG